MAVQISKFESILPDSVKQQIYNATLTEEALLSLPMCDLLRVAHDNPYIKRLMLKYTAFKRTVPLLPEFTLKEHQLRAFEWMCEREKTKSANVRGGILSLQMGLGKTLLSCYYALAFAEGPTLIVASKMVVEEWKTQISRFFGDHVRVCVFMKTPRYKLEEWTPLRFNDYDLVLTSYDTIAFASRKGNWDERVCERGVGGIHNDKIICVHEKGPLTEMGVAFGTEALFCYPWHRVIADETQRFANPKSYIYRAMMAIPKRYGWCLTGTPVRNYDTDIWAQLRWLGYTFISRVSMWKGRGTKIFAEQNLIETMLPMSYDDAGVTLPEKNDIRINVELSEEERERYDDLIHKAREAYRLHQTRRCDFATVLSMFNSVRQACISMDIIEDEKKTFDTRIANIVPSTGHVGSVSVVPAATRSSKIKRVCELIEENFRTKKVIIFSNYVRALKVLADALKTQHIGYSMITGSMTSSKRRAKQLACFREEDETRALLMTYKVGAEGLNLTEATVVICLEPWWTPSVRDQAHARTWRIGQTNDVVTYDLIAAGTVEERILRVCESKRALMDAFKSGSVSRRRRETGLSARDLKMLLDV